MRRIRSKKAIRRKAHPPNYSFTVFFTPVGEREFHRWKEGGISLGQFRLRISGYQVTVPALPGLITYGRTLREARTMAVDAIRCHVEGMLSAGEDIPKESNTYTEKLRVALPA